MSVCKKESGSKRKIIQQSLQFSVETRIRDGDRCVIALISESHFSMVFLGLMHTCICLCGGFGPELMEFAASRSLLHVCVCEREIYQFFV